MAKVLRDIDGILEYPDTKTCKLLLQNITLSPDHDGRIYRAECYSKLKEKVRRDPDLSLILNLKRQNPDIKVKEIAEITGLRERVVREAWDRLRLMAKALIKEFERRKKVG